MRAWQRGSAASAGTDASSGDLALLANSIREDEAALCLDCRVTFSIRNRACPKCGGDHFWLVAKWKHELTEPVPRPEFRVAPLPVVRRRPPPLRLRPVGLSLARA